MQERKVASMQAHAAALWRLCGGRPLLRGGDGLLRARWIGWTSRPFEGQRL